MGKTTINGSFSIAMLNYQRVLTRIIEFVNQLTLCGKVGNLLESEAYQNIPTWLKNHWYSNPCWFGFQVSTKGASGIRVPWLHISELPSGNFLHSYWKWLFIVDFPSKNGGSFHCYVSLPEGIYWNQGIPTRNASRNHEKSMQIVSLRWQDVITNNYNAVIMQEFGWQHTSTC